MAQPQYLGEIIMSFNTSGNKVDNVIPLNQNKRSTSPSSDGNVAEFNQQRAEHQTAEPSCHNGVCQVMWKPRRPQAA